MQIVSGGSKFYANLSKDLADVLPGTKSFSETNLKYMKYFYQLYSQISPQVVDENGTEEISPQLVDELCQVPWGHHRYIIDKCKDKPEKAIFYVRKTIENNWSRAVLLNWLGTDLYERQGKAITNFSSQLPVVQGDLAQEITKDPYNFDFLTLTEGYNEKELKDALESSSEPIGISEYELSKLYPADFNGSLPSIEEIEQEFSDKDFTSDK